MFNELVLLAIAGVMLTLYGLLILSYAGNSIVYGTLDGWVLFNVLWSGIAAFWLIVIVRIKWLEVVEATAKPTTIAPD